MSAYWDNLTEAEFAAEIERTLHGDKPIPQDAPIKRSGRKKRVCLTISEAEEVMS
jgi:hypothetical protein